MVSVLAFNSDDPSSNLHLICKTFYFQFKCTSANFRYILIASFGIKWCLLSFFSGEWVPANTYCLFTPWLISNWRLQFSFCKNYVKRNGKINEKEADFGKRFQFLDRSARIQFTLVLVWSIFYLITLFGGKTKMF